MFKKSESSELKYDIKNWNKLGSKLQPACAQASMGSAYPSFSVFLGNFATAAMAVCQGLPLCG